MKLVPNYWIIVFVLLLATAGKAQNLPYRLVNTVKTSPSDEYRSLLFDHQGLMWIGTTSGLKRYDGYAFHTLKSSASAPNILPNNAIISITEDHNHQLWLGTRNGLVRLNPKTRQTRIYPANGRDFHVIYTLFTSRDGKVWVGSNNYLYRYDPTKDRFDNYSGNKTYATDIDGRRRLIGEYSVKSMVEDRWGNIYIGTWSSGLFRLNTHTGEWIKYPKLNNQNSSYSLFIDSRDRLWVGTWGYGLIRIDRPLDLHNLGIHVFSRGKGSFDTFYRTVEDPVTHTIWTATREGVYVTDFDGNLENMRYYNKVGERGQQLYFCNDIHTDGHGNIWIETLNSGIVHVNTRPSPFHTFNFEKAGYTLPVNSVCNIFTDNGRQVWVTMKPYGIMLHDRVTGQTRFNRDIPGFAALPDNFMGTSITSIVKRHNGELWMGSNSYGICVYRDGKTKLINSENLPFLKDNYISALTETADKVMWVGHEGSLDIVYPDNTGRTLRMAVHGFDLSKAAVNHISEDHRGNKWVATENEGIIRISGNVYRPHTLIYRHYAPRKGNFAVNDAINCFEDSHHRLWAISNSGGLFRYDAVRDRFDAVNTMYGIPGDRIFTINEDRQGALWLSTDNALVRLKINGKKHSVITYGTEDGLTDLQFYPNSSCSHGNRIYIARQNGFCDFNPMQTTERRTYSHPKLIITDILVDERNLTDINLAERSKIVGALPPHTRELIIAPNIQKITIAFALLSYARIDQTQYIYRLSGYDDRWKPLEPTHHRVVFQNLPPGNYTLHVKALDARGNTFIIEQPLDITILPPWWATWWAYLGYLIIAGVVVWGIVRWYRNYLNKENRLRMGVMMSNITHELLTPLTVISASVDDLKEKEPDYTDNYSAIQNNIARLTRLLRQILEVRKNIAGQLRLLVSQGNLSEFVDVLCENIRPMTAQTDSQLQLQIDKGIIAWFDPDKMDKIAYNLLSNALKYNRTGGDVTVSLTATDGMATLTIADEGIGIAPEKMKHLYTRFLDGDYRRKNTSGTGIGLSLAHDLVKLHHGNIECQSTVGRGTTFRVVIPIGKESYTDSEIDTSLDQNTIEQQQAENLHASIPAGYSLTAMLSARTKNYRVLIVEDNEELLSLMRRLLGMTYEVFTAKNGQQALKIIRKEDLDIVVSDIMMPVMDGFALTQAIKQNADYAQLPVILLTAKTTDDDRATGLNIGADDYVPKPFKLSDLQQRMENILANRERMWQKFNRTTTDGQQPCHLSSPDQLFIERVAHCVMLNIADSDYGREKLARDLCISGSTLYNKLNLLTGQTVVGFITAKRLAEACRIARQSPGISLKELSERVGFNSPKYFSKCFKKEYGMLFKDYMNRPDDLSNQSKDSSL